MTAIARKRSGYVNDCRAYCYPDCNIIPRTLKLFPSCKTSNCGINNRHLGIHNGNNNLLNYNLLKNYNNSNMKYL